MSTAYSIGQMNQLSDALELAGFTPDEVTKLRNFPQLKDLRKLVHGDLVLVEPECPWTVDADGIIRFEVVSDGTTPDHWIKEFDKDGRYAGDYAKQGLRSKHFKSTKGVRYPVAVIPGKNFSDSKRITSEIRKDAEGRKFPTPPMEVACLIRRKFTDQQVQQMGLTWIVTMHEPFKDSVGGLDLLSTDTGDYCLGAYYDHSDGEWNPQDGFAFLEQVPQS